MVSKEYDGGKVPPRVEGGQIRVTREYGESLGLSDEDQNTLLMSYQSHSICPPIYWFKDTPDVRRILRIE